MSFRVQSITAEDLETPDAFEAKLNSGLRDLVQDLFARYDEAHERKCMFGDLASEPPRGRIGRDLSPPPTLVGEGSSSAAVGYLQASERGGHSPGPAGHPHRSSLSCGERCNAPCWCSWPPRPRIFSTGVRYSVAELAPEGNVRVFVYRYEEAA